MANEPVNPLESFHKDIVNTPKMAAEGNIADLAAKYAQFKPPGAPQAPSAPLPIEAPPAAIVPQGEPTVAPEKPFESAGVKKDQSFTKDLKSQKKEAEERAARFEQELKELREKEVPRMQKELEEARLNIENAANSKEAKQAKEEMEALKADHAKQQNEWLENQKKLQSELSFYNLESDPDFIQTVKAPREVAKTRAEKILGDSSMITEYRKAMNANFASLTAQDPAEQQRQAEIRDSILGDIYNSLDAFKQGQFTNIVNTAVLPAEENYVSALANHELTKQQIDANRRDTQQQQQYQTQKRWKDAYDSTAQSVAKECDIPEEVGRIIVSNKIPVDFGNDEMIAEATIRDGGSQLPVEEVTRLINQGRYFKKQQAHIKGLNALLKEQQETINKLRGSSTSSETPTAGYQEHKSADPISNFVAAAKAKGWAT
jgi:hypothetical protein